MTIAGVSVRWRYCVSLYVGESIRCVPMPFHCLQVKLGGLTKDQLRWRAEARPPVLSFNLHLASHV